MSSNPYTPWRSIGASISNLRPLMIVLCKYSKHFFRYVTQKKWWTVLSTCIMLTSKKHSWKISKIWSAPSISNWRWTPLRLITRLRIWIYSEYLWAISASKSSTSNSIIWNFRASHKKWMVNSLKVSVWVMNLKWKSTTPTRTSKGFQTSKNLELKSKT